MSFGRSKKGVVAWAKIENACWEGNRALEYAKS